MFSFPLGPTFNPFGSYYRNITRPIGYRHFIFSLPKISLTSAGTVGHCWVKLVLSLLPAEDEFHRNVNLF